VSQAAHGAGLPCRSIAAEELSIGARAALAGRTAEVTADLLAIAEAFPVHDFQASGPRAVNWPRPCGSGIVTVVGGQGGDPGIEFEDLHMQGLGDGPLWFEWLCANHSSPAAVSCATRRGHIFFAPPAIRESRVDRKSLEQGPRPWASTLAAQSDELARRVPAQESGAVVHPVTASRTIRPAVESWWTIREVTRRARAVGIAGGWSCAGR